MDSDSDFAIFRRFGRLHTRILLHKQDELAELESRLDEMDKTESVPYFHSARRHDTNPERKSIIEEAEKKLKEYNELLASHFQHLERPGPKESDLESMTHWMLGNKPLVVEESTFMDDWEDLRRPKVHADHGHLEVLLESWAAAFNGRGIFKAWLNQPKYSRIILNSLSNCNLDAYKNRESPPSGHQRHVIPFIPSLHLAYEDPR